MQNPDALMGYPGFLWSKPGKEPEAVPQQTIYEAYSFCWYN